jgi:hypothetical protein
VESVKDTILTIKQAAQRSRVHRSRIDAAIAGREPKFMKLNTGTRRISAYDLEKWWRSKRAKDFSDGPINSDQPIKVTEPETTHAGPGRETMRRRYQQDLGCALERPARLGRPGTTRQSGFVERT